jgi:endonuclease/exonuclease/phosphatase family metal-dependent hydrolase
MTTELKILCYNMLDVELESNFVPRSMNQICKTAILNTMKKDGTRVDWKNDFADKYVPFHKGFDGIYKTDTRKLWGSEEANRNDKNPNIMQILNNLFGESTALELYNKMKEYNYPWVENRLERVFNEIIKDDPHIVCLQEYGNCKFLPSMEKRESVKIIGEFSDDINKNMDSSMENEIQPGSLADKLIEKGYVYKLYSYNPNKQQGDDGVAIFYKGAVLKPFEYDNKIYIDMDKGLKQQYKEYTTQRGCGLLELIHRATSKKIIICTTHIQSVTNEKVQNAPYAIRGGQLEYIKYYINKNYTNANDLVIFCGDFNLNLNEPADFEIVDKFENGENPNILKRIKYNKESDDFGLVTSYPSGRKEYIDYFFTNCGGVLSAPFKKLNELNGETIPNSTDQPSDHIPILLTISLDNKVGGVTRKNKKSKTKKSRKFTKKTRKCTKKSKKCTKKSKKRRGF